MKRGYQWPIAMAGLLALTVAANVGVAIVASGDPSFAIEPDYYRKAIAWDSALEQSRANADLGWRIEPALDAFARGKGAALRVRILDASGAPISRAAVRVSALHNARARDVIEDSLRPSGGGEYVATLPIARAGQWELRFDVRAGGARFTSTARIEAQAAPDDR
jgi:nitrogen fixation protein FixH